MTNQKVTIALRNSLMYVRFEPISTAFVTLGVDPVDMLSTASPNPRHLLLLPPVTDDLSINQHTGFNVLDGEEEARSFLSSEAGKKAAWLDVREADYVDDLLPQEIAELLYLAHKKTHMVLPFYYKLQNEYARVPLPSGLVTSYWRHPEQFEAVFSAAVNRHLADILASRPFWLRGRRSRGGVPLPSAVQKTWQDLLPDGVAFDWPHAQVTGHVVKIALLRVQERRLFAEMDQDALDAQELGHLILNRNDGTWQAELN